MSPTFYSCVHVQLYTINPPLQKKVFNGASSGPEKSAGSKNYYILLFEV